MTVAPCQEPTLGTKLGGAQAPLRQMWHFSSLGTCYANEHQKALPGSEHKNCLSPRSNHYRGKRKTHNPEEQNIALQTCKSVVQSAPFPHVSVPAF